MLTLSYGFLKPENNDLASVWWSSIQTNAQKMNDHNHDGANSALLTPASISKYSTTVLAGGWTNLTNGNYSQVVNVPAGITDVTQYMLYIIENSAPGVYKFNVGLTIEYISATSYKLYTNTPTAYIVKYI